MQDTSLQSEISKIQIEVLDNQEEICNQITKRIETKYEAKINTLKEKYETNIKSLETKYENKIKEIIVKHDNDLVHLREELMESFLLLVHKEVDDARELKMRTNPGGLERCISSETVQGSIGQERR